MKKRLLLFTLLFLQTAAFAQECPYGDIQMTLPDGKKVLHKYAVDCCSKNKSCQPCKDNSSFTEWTKLNYPECETAKCKLEQICHKRYVHKDKR